MPSAGPGLVLGHGDGGVGPGEFQGDSSALYLYLASHQAGEKYMVGVESSRSADDLIIQYGAPVIAMGGYSGGDNILTNETLKTLIHDGKIRFFLLGQKGQGMPGRESGGVTQWVQDSCPAVSESEWNDETNQVNSTSPMRNTLYDCKGVL